MNLRLGLCLGRRALQKEKYLKQPYATVLFRSVQCNFLTEG